MTLQIDRFSLGVLMLVRAVQVDEERQRLEVLVELGARGSRGN